jgi:hypothetical protein
MINEFDDFCLWVFVTGDVIDLAIAQGGDPQKINFAQQA